MAHPQATLVKFGCLLPFFIIAGCASNRPAARDLPADTQTVDQSPSRNEAAPGVAWTAFDGDQSAVETDSGYELPHQTLGPSSLGNLEQLAVNQNPALVRIYREYLAASSRSRYADKLPDPKVGANIFVDPIETASGSQRANVSVSQTIPWLSKLNAEEQRAYFQAFAISADYQSERLKVLAAVRAGWYRLYVIEKEIETIGANQLLLESLIEVANARIATGAASGGDVLLGALELSRLEEQLLTFRRQRTAIEAEVNRLIARSAETRIIVPETIRVELPRWTAAEIYQIALQSQPEIQAARLRTQATRWGIETARLSRRPSVTLSANYFPTDNNRPATSVVNVGEDPWSLGLHVSVPIWRDKYSAIQDEATWKHFASNDSLEEVYDRYDALILELLTEARRASETATLYQETILPQARQTLEADQESYAKGVVEFDRVVRDYRSLLTLELGYHQSVGELAVAVARIRRAAGQDIPLSAGLIPPAPPE